MALKLKLEKPWYQCKEANSFTDPCFSGLDLSNTCSGISIFNHLGIHIFTGTLNFEKEQGKESIEEICKHDNLVLGIRAFHFKRYEWYIENIINILKQHKVKFVVIEGYAWAGQGQNSILIPELGSLIRARLRKEGILVYELSPQGLKIFLTGKGNTHKDIIILEVFKRYGIDFPDISNDEKNDAADSYGLGKFSYHLFTGDREGLTVFQLKEILKAEQRIKEGGWVKKEKKEKKVDK